MATTTKTNGSDEWQPGSRTQDDARGPPPRAGGRSSGQDSRRPTDFTNERQVLDQGESSEVDIQDEIEFALIQMKAETLNKIDAALRRLEEGTYGDCFECGDEIAEARLRALPFAVRCRDCEEARETAEQRERMAQRRGSSALFVDMVN